MGLTSFVIVLAVGLLVTLVGIVAGTLYSILKDVG